MLKGCQLKLLHGGWRLNGCCKGRESGVHDILRFLKFSLNASQDSPKEDSDTLVSGKVKDRSRLVTCIPFHSKSHAEGEQKMPP